MKIALPEQALVVLVGPAGAGKSTFARAHFKATEVVSSDACRALVADDESDQSATAPAFEILHLIARLRLRRRRLTVVDAVNARPPDRRPLLELAQQEDCAAVALVLDLPEGVCVARDAGRTGRRVGRRAIHAQAEQIRRSLEGLSGEGFAQVHLLNAAAVDEATFERVPLAVNRRGERAPFDLIGDVHGCSEELDRLLGALGYLPPPGGDRGTGAWSHPGGRRAVFVGDLAGLGPDTPGVLRRVMAMTEAKHAICVRGDQDEALRLALTVGAEPGHDLVAALDELGKDPDLAARAAAFLEGLPSHYVLERGALVVAHAGIKGAMQSRDSPRIRRFTLLGEEAATTDHPGQPPDLEWARTYRGRALVVFGHMPVEQPSWRGRTIDIDTGCVFGGRLTALRYPELELVSVDAAKVHQRAVGTAPGVAGSSAIPIINSDIQPDTFPDLSRETSDKEAYMPQTVREVMTAKPLALQEGTTLVEAAAAMRNHDVGDVVLLNDDQVTGIVTDRDITVRAVAEGMDPNSTVLAQIASKDLTTISPEATVEEAVELMRRESVRRLPVVEEGRPVGIVSLGDLAVERAPDSALADISAADPNR
ncbi:MAG: CBS domain-containing protein [Candidatus Dormibacteraeota bacterium]|nr:CBS domain-containing protein [Candidatus Dormibacteraeota bacterium]